jgi:maltose-binding protein MalE
MRMGTRIALALATPLLIAAPLAGCAPRKSGDAPGAVQLTVWMQMDPQERTRFEANLAAYEALHPEVTVDIVPYNTEDLRQQFISAASGGAGPHIIFGPSDQVGPLSVTDLIKPLDTALPAGFFDRFVPQALDTLDGHLWAAPDQVGNHLVLCYNRALVPTPPRTHDEFLRIAKAQTRDGVYGFTMNTMEPYWLAPFLAGFGGWVMDEAQRPTLDTPAMRQALAYLADLKNRSGVMPREATYENSHTLFQEGKAAMIVNGPWSWADYRKAGIDLGVAPLWELPNGQRARAMTASKGYSINANVKDSELPAVIALIDYLTSPEAELRDAVALGTLPSHREAWADPAIQGDPTLKASQEAYGYGRRMPVVPEMRVIWDTMRPEMQKAMSGARDPATAARAMQAAAAKQIAAMKK